MTATTAATVKDQKLVSLGLVESASVNSFADFVPSALTESKAEKVKPKEDFKNIFICHLIFYAIFCVSVAMHIFIDLGFGTFVKNKFLQLMGNDEKSNFKRSPAFA